CNDCAGFFRAMKSDGDEVEAWFSGLPPAPPEFAAGVMHEIKRAGVRKRRGITRWIAFAAAACIIVGFLIPNPHRIGKIDRLMDKTGMASPTVIKTGVDLERDGSPRAATLHSAIMRGDGLLTDPDCVAFVRLKSGDEVIVNETTKVFFPGGDDDRRQVVRLAHGEVFVRAAKSVKPLEVQTPAGVAEVVGTQFSLSYDSKAARAVLTVCEGKVRFHNPRGQQLVGAGQQSMASATAGPSDPQTVDARVLTAWVDPPSPAKLRQTAEEIVDSLKARAIPEKDVFEAGEPIRAAIELTNAGTEPLLVSRILFIAREDNALQRQHPKLSQVMLTKVFGTDLADHECELPEPLVEELQPGAVWRVQLDLSQPSVPASRLIAGPGAYSMAVAFAAARKLPGAPGDSLVWADAVSESSIIRVMSTASPVEGKPVLGLQLDFTARTPGCRLGKDLTLDFGFRGVTSDRVAVSAAGDFRLKVEPATFGAISHQAMDSAVVKKLDTPLGELGIDAGGASAAELVQLLAERLGITVLADPAALKGEHFEPDAARTLRENLQAFLAPTGGSLESGQSAAWIVAGGKAWTGDIHESLAKVEGNRDNWIILQGVDYKDGRITLPTGSAVFPRPGLYRCTVEYTNKQSKAGQDWPWLGSVKSIPIIVAVLEPPPPAKSAGNGLDATISQAKTMPGRKSVQLELALRNTSNREIAIKLDDGLVVQDELLTYDILNFDCYDRPDQALVERFDAPVPLKDGKNDVSELLGACSDRIGSFEGMDLLRGRSIIALGVEEVSLGELLEYIARSCNVSFVRSGQRQFIIPGDKSLGELASRKPSVAGGTLLTIPPQETRTATLTVAVDERGAHRLQVQYRRTGAAAGEELLWKGSAASNPMIVEIQP
ncbi:MAG TPA: FecR family protein, partial [Planctomycetota bacterium]|nr:FecR family protein [Planctomycetota bacterium]